MNSNKLRCSWVNLKNERYIKYHDEEWGKLTTDDKSLFELFILESFQAGLSWECVLNKRDNFRAAFDNFDIEKIILYGDEKISRLASNAGIIRNRRKIIAAIENAKVFKAISLEFGGFYSFLSGFTEGKIIFEEFTERTTSPLSDKISLELKKRGMSFVGSTIIYSFLQAAGIINGHSRECFCFSFS